MKVLSVVIVPLLAFFATPASAEHGHYKNPYNEWGWADRAFNETHTRTRNTPRYRPARDYHRNPTYRHHDHRPQHRVHTHVLPQFDQGDHDHHRRDTRCRGDFQAAGDQALTEDGAKQAAEKSFQQEIRFAHGELWADPQHAQDKTFLCVKSSVGGGLFHRCRMRAKPCMPERQ